MGRPKLSLPFGDELLLQRVVRVLSGVVDPIVVVAAPGQDVPELPPAVEIVRDNQEGLGPLAGLAVGLEALAGRAEAAYVSACDVPLLKPEFVRAMIDRLGDHDLAIPRDGEFHHPLAAVYRTRLAPKVRALLDAQRVRPFYLVQESDAEVIDVSELRSVDPELASLMNMNAQDDYRRALSKCGIRAAGEQ